LELRATVTNDSKIIIKTFSFFEELEIPFNIVFAYESENKNHVLSKHLVNLSQIEMQFGVLEQYYLEKAMKQEMIYARSIQTKLESIAYRVKKYFSCGGGHNFYSVINNGEIYSCEHLAGLKKYSLGNIHNNPDLQHIDLQSKDVETIDSCKECWLRYLCAGGCFSANISSTGFPRHPEVSRCDLTKIEWEFIIKLYYKLAQLDSNYFVNNDKTNKKSYDC
jgi:radical SAM protein with 4Fe4S-binding SPASM domain